MSEFLAPMKSKKAKQNNSTDESDPHCSGVSSRDQETTAESFNTKNVDTAKGSQEEKPPISSVGIEDTLEDLVVKEHESSCEEKSCKDDILKESCSGDEYYKTTGDAEIEHKEEDNLEPSTKPTQDENMDTLTETLWIPFTDGSGQPYVKDDIERKLKEFLQVTSYECITSAQDSVKKAQDIIDKAVAKCQLYFQNSLSGSASKTDSSKAEKKPVTCKINPSCTDITEEFQLKYKLHPLDHHLLCSLVENGEDVASGVEIITELRTLLKHGRRLTTATCELYELGLKYQDEIMKARDFSEEILEREELKLDPKDGYFVKVDFIRGQLVKVFKEIEELKKLILE